MKKCPYCAEKIQSEAIVCRYCHKYLTSKTSEASPGESKDYIKKTDDILIRIFTIFGLLFIVYLVYTNLVNLTQPSFPELEYDIQKSEDSLRKLEEAFKE